jgi:hypothetical protein
MFGNRSVYIGFLADRVVMEQDFPPVLLLSPPRITLSFLIYFIPVTHPNAVRHMNTCIVKLPRIAFFSILKKYVY